MENVLLISKDEETFSISTTAAKLSKTVENLLSVMDNDDKEPIPVMEVESKILKLVVQWLNQKSNTNESELEKFEDFEKEFFEMEISTVFAVIQAANYMDIEQLLKRACTEVALRIAGKSTMEMREILGIINDWNQDELRNIDDESCMLSEKK